mmetsp:Transcript_39645/g.77523  ORF Transcript_39645/g.77523 Transcript_39645/m.77523 type:complete len:111 (+) Transcript_39645:336-668(+)
MCAFPSVEVLTGARAAADAAGESVDALYALSLLEETGICVVPASGQAAGLGGFRTTLLPPEDQLAEAIRGSRATTRTWILRWNLSSRPPAWCKESWKHVYRYSCSQRKRP